MSTYKTPNGKTIELYNEGMMVKAKFVEGGELPGILSGVWTDKNKAQETIISYLDSKTKKVKEA